MIYKIDIKHPFIQTIPDESAPFLILEEGSKPFDKFVMENYINFRACDYQKDVSDGFCLRFENYINWESFDGFSSLHIPLCLQKNFNNTLEFLIVALNRGFIIMCDYNTYYVKVVSKGFFESHRIILYGFDDNRKVFFCMDFLNGILHTFEASFDEIIQAIYDYPWPGEEKGGVLGLKYDDRLENENISYYKLYVSLNNLCNNNFIQQNNGIEAYGRRALSVFREGISHYTSIYEQQYRSHYWLNYIRESCKLMEYRLKYLENNYQRSISAKTTNCFFTVKNCADKIFPKLLKYRIKNSINKELIENIICQCYEIENRYIEFAESFRDDVFKIWQIEASHLDHSSLYTTTEHYIST